MNKLTYSLLIGFAVTAIYFGIVLFKKVRLEPFTRTYHGHYVVRVHAKDNALTGGVKLIDKVTDILKSRISGAYGKPEINTINDQLLDLTISNIIDTNQISRLITANSTLEFREMYTLKEDSRYFTRNMDLFGYTKGPDTTAQEKKIDTTSKDSAFVKFSETEPSSDELPQTSSEPLIIFSQPYQQDNGMRFLPSIGTVRITDTAAVNKIFRRSEFASSFPEDLKLLYGPIIERFGEKNKEFLYLYAVRALPDRPAILNNDDIINAKMDYSQTGKPEILFDFNPVASKKWERMTTANIGKPIAIILDNMVISAPNVNSTISGGTSSISGGFTVVEAMDLALLLNSSSMPATTDIVKQEITIEKASIIPKNLLLYLLIFALVTGVSYLITHFLKLI